MSVLGRALNAMALVSESSDGITLTEASEKLGYPLATTHRLLTGLCEEGFVERDPRTLRYSPGRRLFRLSAVMRQQTIVASALPDLRRLSEEFDETVMLTQLVDERAVCVGLVESRRPMHLSVRIGQAVPLHAAASARVLYHDRADSEIEALLANTDFAQLLPDTPSDISQVLEHVRSIRRYGYDVCDNEFDLQIWAASAPVRDATGSTVAAVTLTSTQERSSSQQRRLDIINNVMRTAGEISSSLGAADPGNDSARLDGSSVSSSHL